MPVLKLEKFGGQLPQWDDRLLPPDQASQSVNCYLYSGGLQGWRTPKKLRNLTNGAAQFAYRVPQISSSIAAAYLVFKANPIAGDTFKVGEETYTWAASITGTSPSYTVLVGANAAASAANAFAALTGAAGAGTLYGNGTTINPAIDQNGLNVLSTTVIASVTYNYIKTQAPSFGAAYNTTTATESTGGARTTFLFDLVSFADTTTTFVGGTNQSSDDTITGPSYWLEFVDPDTTVARSPVLQDKFGRFYFGSPSQPPQYNTYSRIAAGNTGANAPFLLGVPAPACAPTVTATGGGINTDNIGNSTSTTASTYAPGANVLYLIPVTPANNCIINDINFFPNTTNSNARFAGVLYSDNNGVPGVLLNIGQEVIGSNSGAQITSTFSTQYGLLSQVQYWIGFIADSDIAYTLTDNITHAGVVHPNTYISGAPNTAPAMTTGQGSLQLWGTLTESAVLEARVYVYTWQTAYGEEGPPSPTTEVTSWSNATWNIGLWTPPPDDMGVKRNITSVNIYRTITGSGGNTTFFYVATVPVGTTTYADTKTDDVVSVAGQLLSTTWFPPPTDLQGIKAMPNGVFVGWRANEIWFSEPFRPHAWPLNYALTTEFPVVGVGVAGQSAIACTTAHPEIASGVNPAGMAQTKVKMPAPCTSAGSIISTDQGVYYHSINGLIYVDSSGNPTNYTDGWITREKWDALVPLKNIRAIHLASQYIGFGTVNGADHSVAQQGFGIELSQDANSFTIWPQPGGHRMGFNQMTAPNTNTVSLDIYNVMNDPWSGVGLIIQNGSIYYWDFTDPAPTMMPWRWRSKRFQQTSKHNYEAMKVFFDVPAGTPAQSATRDVSAPQTLKPGQYIIVRIFMGDGSGGTVLWTTREVRSSGELLRILSGAKAEFWQFELEGIVVVSNMQVATSVRELAQV